MISTVTQSVLQAFAKETLATEDTAGDTGDAWTRACSPSYSRTKNATPDIRRDIFEYNILAGCLGLRHRCFNSGDALSRNDEYYVA